MSSANQPILARLLSDVVGHERMRTLLFSQVFVMPELLEPSGVSVPRAVLAQAMNLLLFEDLLARVPAGRQRVADRVRAGHPVRFDHGALRTVVSDRTALPSGHLAFSRILEPLGFAVTGRYPLPRINMLGRAFAHRDHPEDIAQFFVSELDLTRFSPQFRAAAERVIRTSRDPLTPRAATLLAKLAHDKALPYDEARELLPQLISCFARQHETPSLSDYRILLQESAEMAWIATEGNTFNHATERVTDIVSVAREQHQLGRPMKGQIEVSSSGRVRQTAYFAAAVARTFRLEDGTLSTATVPGSFYEFIERAELVDAQCHRRLDLTFDSSNAQGIFKMTAAA